MNTGMLVLVGGVVGAGVLFYTSSSGGAARPELTPTPAAQETQELAHSGKTPKPSPTAVPETPDPSATPTPPRLTLAQVFALPRPAIPTPAGSAAGGNPSWVPPTAQPTSSSPLPTGTPTPTTTLAVPPSEAPSTPTPIPATPTPTPPPYQDPWSIPTPPPLPPYPDAGLEPHPPGE
ncbi:MAG: hypothetical protein AB7O30_03615 [Dehalococcoidia bacterium]